MTQLNIYAVKAALAKLGYYDGPIDSDYLDPNYRDDLKRFQRDYGLVVDGWYGAKSEAVLLPLSQALAGAPANLQHMFRWKATTYYVGEVAAWSGPLVPMKTPTGQFLAQVPAGAFVEAALEGTTKLVDGRLANVASPAYSVADPILFSPVYQIAKRNGWIPDKPGYAGITLTPDHGSVAQARNFEIRNGGSHGWPIEHGIECAPFRTLAADIGVLAKHDPKWKGRGGVCPLGTKVWILELVGKTLPDGTVHDGWCTVNDTGGGIYGAHYDVFAGSRRAALAAAIPDLLHVWWDGCEARLPFGYAYGL